MIKKESTKLGYIADYKKDVDDIISLLQTYPDNAEIKKNFYHQLWRWWSEPMIFQLIMIAVKLKILKRSFQINLRNYQKCLSRIRRYVLGFLVLDLQKSRF